MYESVFKDMILRHIYAVMYYKRNVLENMEWLGFERKGTLLPL